MGCALSMYLRQCQLAPKVAPVAFPIKLVRQTWWRGDGVSHLRLVRTVRLCIRQQCPASLTSSTPESRNGFLAPPHFYPRKVLLLFPHGITVGLEPTTHRLTSRLTYHWSTCMDQCVRGIFLTCQRTIEPLAQKTFPALCGIPRKLESCQ